MDEGLDDEEFEDLEEGQKELMELMEAESKPYFMSILWRLPKIGQLLWSKDSLKIIFFLTSLKTGTQPALPRARPRG